MRNTTAYRIRAEKTSKSVKEYAKNNHDLLLKRAAKARETKKLLPKEILDNCTRKNEKLYTNGVIKKYFKNTDTIPSDFHKPLTKRSINHYKSQLKKLDRKLYAAIRNKLKQEKIKLNMVDKELNNRGKLIYKELDIITRPKNKQKRSKKPYVLKRSNQINNLKHLLKKVAYCKMSNKHYNELSKSELYRNSTIFRNMLHPEIQIKANMALKQYNNSIKGKPRSEKDIIAIHKTIDTPEYKEKMKQYYENLSKEEKLKRYGSARNRHWYTNGVNDLYILEGDFIPEGYTRGRCFRQNGYKNHKILKIEKINNYEKVYDLEIEDNHNFALDAGIFVHNSVHIEKDRNHNKISRERFFRFSRWCYI